MLLATLFFEAARQDRQELFSAAWHDWQECRLWRHGCRDGSSITIIFCVPVPRYLCLEVVEQEGLQPFDFSRWIGEDAFLLRPEGFLRYVV